MALNLTATALQLLNKREIKPVLVLEINGVSTVYTSSLVGAASESVLISLDGTTTDINQQLSPDRSGIASVSSMKINLIDKDDEITQLITPGAVVTDLLGRRARVRVGFQGSTYPDDYITVFRGIIDDLVSGQGHVEINIGHPDQKKRNTIFEKATTQLNGALNDSATTITVDDTSDFLVGITGPSGGVDSSFTAYIRINDELISYTGKTATTFTGCTRGRLGTTAASHSDDDEVNSFYRLEGNGIDLALKIMMSGWGTYYETDVAVTNFVRTTGTTDVANSMFFDGIDVREKYGLNEGDYVTTTGASNGANNVSLKSITTIVVDDGSSYIVVSGVTFVSEIGTSAVVSFRSQYDTLPSGMKMHGDEVDVDQHVYWYGKYLSSFDYDFYLKDTIDGKEFLDKKVYLPMSAYSLPRKSRASMGMHTRPLPFDSILTIDENNICAPDKIKIRRQLGKNFYNTVVYKFEEDVLEDKYLFGHIEVDATSKTRIPIGNKTLVIEAPGMRIINSGSLLAEDAADRILNRYKYGAEYFEGVQVLFSTGFRIEPGDIVYVDGTSLNISDTATGSRGMSPRLFEVINKNMNIKTGSVSLSLVDTNLSLANRYGLISPSSQVSSGASTTEFTITSSYASVYGVNEYRKWERWIGAGVKIRNSDFSDDSDSVLIAVSNTNVVTVFPALSFTPDSTHIMELSHYNNQTDGIKSFYTFMTDASAFDDGEDPYKMS